MHNRLVSFTEGPHGEQEIARLRAVVMDASQPMSLHRCVPSVLTALQKLEVKTMDLDTFLPFIYEKMAEFLPQRDIQFLGCAAHTFCYKLLCSAVAKS
jgi:hypothetical protein